MFKTAILTALVLFATIGLFTIVLAPGGITNPAQAFRKQGTGGGIGVSGGARLITAIWRDHTILPGGLD